MALTPVEIHLLPAPHTLLSLNVLLLLVNGVLLMAPVKIRAPLVLHVLVSAAVELNVQKDLLVNGVPIQLHVSPTRLSALLILVVHTSFSQIVHHQHVHGVKTLDYALGRPTCALNVVVSHRERHVPWHSLADGVMMPRSVIQAQPVHLPPTVPHPPHVPPVRPCLLVITVAGVHQQKHVLVHQVHSHAEQVLLLIQLLVHQSPHAPVIRDAILVVTMIVNGVVLLVLVMHHLVSAVELLISIVMVN